MAVLKVVIVALADALVRVTSVYGARATMCIEMGGDYQCCLQLNHQDHKH
jgi:hypothetical protein